VGQMSHTVGQMSHTVGQIKQARWVKGSTH